MILAAYYFSTYKAYINPLFCMIDHIPLILQYVNLTITLLTINN